jgi:hypothetical protein
MYFDGWDGLLDVAKLGKVAVLRCFVASLSLPLSVLLVASLAPLTVRAQPSATYLLAPATKAGDLQRVRVAIEIQGNLKTNPDGKKVTRIPLGVNATLSYEEKYLVSTGEKCRVARFYEEAKADLRIKDTQQQASLSEEHRLIAVHTNRDEATFLSPHGPLTRDELDLIDVPGNSALGVGLLPSKEVRTGESWVASERVLGLLLGLEAVSKSDVTATLTKVEGDVAIIDMAGLVQGAVGGVATEIEMKGKLNFTLHDRRLTWMAFALKENRAIGHAEPGFETVARVRVAMQPASASANLGDTVIAELPAETDSGAALLKFEAAKSGFRVLHDRRWRAMVDNGEVSILRLVDRGDLIAQCNISPLPDMTPGKYLALEEFKAEIEEALAKNFGQIIEAAQTKNENGLRVLKIVASGTSSELPIQWIYYHVSNEQGRRAAYVFTLEARLLERFGAADDLLTSTFEFTARPGPTPANAKSTSGNLRPSATAPANSFRR